jgi:FkbM family methyltransferase
MKVVGISSLYEPLEFLETRIKNLNQCNMEGVLVYFSDCSSESTWYEIQVLLRDCKFPFRADHHPERKGIYWTWNWIIQKAGDFSPQYFTNVNADDIYDPLYFQKVSGFLDQNPQYDIAACHWYQTFKKRQIWPPAETVAPEHTPHHMHTLGHFPMWRSSLHNRVGLFDPRLIVGGDSELWFRVRSFLGSDVIAVLPDHLACYLRHENNAHETLKAGGKSGEAYDFDFRAGHRGTEDWLKVIQRYVDGTTVIVECGPYLGKTTQFLHDFFRLRRMTYYAFEPNPENVKRLDQRLPGGVQLVEVAVGDYNGKGQLYLSRRKDRFWGLAASLRKPTGYQEARPEVSFPETAEVEVRTLDHLLEKEPKVDLVWAQIQGCERDLIQGASEALKKIRFLYLGSEEGLYDGQWTRQELIDELDRRGFELGRPFTKTLLFYNRQFFTQNPFVF